MNKQYFYLSIILMLFLSCEGPFFDVPADEDSIPPTLTITFPADQSILSDSVLISAYALITSVLKRLLFILMILSYTKALKVLMSIDGLLLKMLKMNSIPLGQKQLTLLEMRTSQIRYRC